MYRFESEPPWKFTQKIKSFPLKNINYIHLSEGNYRSNVLPIESILTILLC